MDSSNPQYQAALKYLQQQGLSPSELALAEQDLAQNMGITDTTVTQGQEASDGSGINQYDPNTGQKLQPGQSVTINQPTSTSSAASSSAPTYNSAWAARGVTQAQWNSMSPIQQATTAAALNVATSNYASTGNAITVAQALQTAASDPNITNAFSSALSMSQAEFSQTIQQYAAAQAQTESSESQQFYNDRKALALSSAAAGQAYSGFRGQAQSELANTETGIVSSSNATLQQNLQNLTNQFTSLYGSAAVPTAAQGSAIAGSLATPASVSVTNPFNTSGLSISGLLQNPDTTTTNIAGTVVPNITGTQTTAEQNEINTEAANLVNLGLPGNINSVTP